MISYSLKEIYKNFLRRWLHHMISYSLNSGNKPKRTLSYKEFWSIVDGDVIAAVRDFFNHHICPDKQTPRFCLLFLRFLEHPLFQTFAQYLSATLPIKFSPRFCQPDQNSSRMKRSKRIKLDLLRVESYVKMFSLLLNWSQIFRSQEEPGEAAFNWTSPKPSTVLKGISS